jgi:hypothetical protein
MYMDKLNKKKKMMIKGKRQVWPLPVLQSLRTISQTRFWTENKRGEPKGHQEGEEKVCFLGLLVQGISKRARCFNSCRIQQ